jgi:hypothetical protein
LGNSGEIDLRGGSVAFWCDSIFGFYTLKPIVQKYQQNNYTVYIYSMKKDVRILRDYINNTQNIEIIDIESINSFLLRVLNYIFKRFLTNPNFTQMHYENRSKDRSGLYHKFLGNIFYINNNNINIIYQKFFSLFRSRLKSDLLISISRVKASYLICSKNIKHISIMESWDHPVKSPYWHKPDYILTWNKDLKKDYKEFQNFKDINISYIQPLKFRYIKERRFKDLDILEGSLKNNDFIQDIQVIKNKEIVTYVTTTSSINKAQHHGEMKLIGQLCQATRKLNKKIYIKPKPNGPKGDYDIFKDKYNHVIVGTYATNPNSIDILDEEYHTFRYLLLYYSDLIINFGTTFVLESSIMDKPIFQLNLSKEYYGDFGKYSNNIHIKKYLLNEYSFEVKSAEDVVEVINKKYDSFEKYSKNLKRWLIEK